jgi:hypothetical protein
MLISTIMLISAGMRPIEALSIRIKGLDLKSNTSQLLVEREYIKTRSLEQYFLSKN